MKRLALLSTLFLCLLIITACRHSVEPPASKAVKGEWEWEYSTGGLDGHSLAPADNTLVTLDLNNDSTYTNYLNNMPQFSGSYSIQAGNYKPVLHFDHPVSINQLSINPEQQIMVWDTGHLQLMDYQVNDGYIHFFKSLK